MGWKGCCFWERWHSGGARSLFRQLLRLLFPRAAAGAGATPWQLHPDQEGNVANAVSAAALSTMASLALATAVRNGCRRAGWIAIGGWAALAATGAYLAWEEVVGFHTTLKPALSDDVISRVERPFLWPLVLSPLIVAFVVVMGVFVRKELRHPAVRAPFVLGLVAWLLVVAHEVSYPFVFKGRAELLEVVIEETFEFGGTLLFGLSAAIALRSDRASQIRLGMFTRRRMPTLLFGTMAAVAVLAGLAAVFVFRAPLIDARAPGHVGQHLRDKPRRPRGRHPRNSHAGGASPIPRSPPFQLCTERSFGDGGSARHGIRGDVFGAFGRAR